MTLQTLLIKQLRQIEPLKIVVACAQEHSILSSIQQACAMGVVTPILVGDQAQIKALAQELAFNLDDNQIIDEPDVLSASQMAVKIALESKALLMKGQVDTKVILSALLKQSKDLNTFFSHVSLAYVPTYRDKLYIVTDAGLNIAPSVKQKLKIIDNAIELAQALSIHPIHVALLSAVEKVNEKIPSSIEALEIMDLSKQGRFKDVIVEGPYALDNAINLEAAQHKGVTYLGAGQADILIVPNIETGNVLIKSMTYFAKAETAGLVLGAVMPVIVNSRADSAQDKLNSILLGCLMVQHG